MNQLISVLITAWKEERTIANCIRCIADTTYSGIPENFEILLACPDEETHAAGLGVIKELGIENKFRFIKDPGEGKPAALNMLMKEAKGEIWIFTDGDVHFERGAVRKLITHFEETNEPDVGISVNQQSNSANNNNLVLDADKSFQNKLVTGRPVSEDSSDSMMGYFGHLLSDAANHKRMVDLTSNPQGKSLSIVKKRNFFPVSGYIYAMNKTEFRFPNDCLVDDAYISYEAYNNGWKIEYEPEAIAFVKYPTNLGDYFKQKKRSTGGYIQLWEYGVVKPETKSRSFWRELEYFWFPIVYAKNIKQFFWSLMLYPIRLWLWIQILWERKIQKKDFVKTWVRVESTK